MATPEEVQQPQNFNLAKEISDESETPTQENEWWEQFGDCYDYWPSLPDSEYDYLYWGLVKKNRG